MAELRKCCRTPRGEQSPHHPGCPQGFPQPKPRASTIDPDVRADWSGACIVCGESPVLPATGMCGPCTFGEADTIDGDW
jgi:hypothetical protein